VVPLVLRCQVFGGHLCCRFCLLCEVTLTHPVCHSESFKVQNKGADDQGSKLSLKVATEKLNDQVSKSSQAQVDNVKRLSQPKKDEKPPVSPKVHPKDLKSRAPITTVLRGSKAASFHPNAPIGKPLSQTDSEKHSTSSEEGLNTGSAPPLGKERDKGLCRGRSDQLDN
jgi:hypothetical protein